MDEFKSQSVPNMETLEEQQLVSKPVSDFAITPPQTPVGNEPPSSSKWEAVLEFFSNNKWYVLALVLGLVIIAVLGYFAFRTQTPEPTQQAKVNVLIDAPEMVPSGNEAIYKFTIVNEDPVKLVDMELELVYNDMTYVSSSPRANNLSGNSYLIPDLSTGQNAVVMVKVQVQGNINDQKTLVAKLKYKYINFNSQFVKEVSHTTRIVAADIILDVSGSEEVNNAQVAEYTINYRNNSDKEITNGRIQVTYPEGFSYGNAEPDTALGNNIWNINSLAPRGSGKIQFQGNFNTSRPGDQKTFKVEFLVADERGDYYAQSASAFTTRISTQPLLIEQKLQNSSNIVAPGDTLTYEIRFQNNAAVVATGVIIILELDSPAIDLTSIRSDTGLVRDNSITWNASGVPALERLNPSDSGTVRFTVRVNDPAVAGNAKNIEVKSAVKIRSNEFRDFLPGNALAIKVSSPSDMSGSSAHAGGSLPPRVGVPSTYTVYIELKNSSNDYSNGVVTALIPLGLNFDTNSILARERSLVKFDSSTGRLTWDVGQLVAHAGKTQPVRMLSFNVGFTPSQAELNQAVQLLRDVRFNAKDSFTNQDISLEVDGISTEDSPNGSRDGRVQN